MKKSNLTTPSLVALLSIIFIFANCSKDVTLDPSVTTASYVPPKTGQFLVSLSGYRDAKSGLLAIYDKSGNIIKQLETGSTTMNFKKWYYEDGTARYTYLRYDASKPHVATAGYNAGQMVVLDDSLKEINRLTLLPYGKRTAADNNALDGHDFILISDKHYISMAYFEKAVNNIPSSLNPIANCKVVAPIIQEVNNGEVVWEWDGTNTPELYTTSIEGNDFKTGAVTQDYAHINSMYVDPKDNNLVVSFRNLNQVMKIKRGTDNILWRLGGTNSDFPVTADQKFLRQHHAYFLADGKTMLIFDNGDIKERAYTRIVEFVLDETNKTVKSFTHMDMPNRTFTQYTGSVEKTDSTYFINAGSDPRVLEVNYTTGQTILEVKLALPSYRAYRY